MASRLHESINSLGVLLSLAVSFFGFYYQHLRTSEAVDALVSDTLVKTDNMSKLQGMTVDLILVNKGDNPVTISDLWFEFDVGASPCCITKAARKVNEDTLMAPILLPSKQAPKMTLRFTFDGLPTGGPWVSSAPRLAFRPKEDAPEEPLPPTPTINVEKISITLTFTTIGPKYGRQKMKMPVGTLSVKDGGWTSFTAASAVSVVNELTPVRKDPSSFRSFWNYSLTK
jgi:hypothetical protein